MSLAASVCCVFDTASGPVDMGLWTTASGPMEMVPLPSLHHFEVSPLVR